MHAHHVALSTPILIWRACFLPLEERMEGEAAVGGRLLEHSGLLAENQYHRVYCVQNWDIFRCIKLMSYHYSKTHPVWAKVIRLLFPLGPRGAVPITGSIIFASE